MDSYIQYSHEALCLLLERKDCEIERLTAKLAECTEEAARLKQNIVDTLTERLSDVETARKQAAMECYEIGIKLLQQGYITMIISKYMDEIQDKFGLEG